MDLDNVNELRKIGVIPQKQKDYYVIRIRSIAGDISAEQLGFIATVSKDYADGQIHLSTRQGIELHNIPACNVIKARNELEGHGINLGACGPRVRGILACPGASTCPHGIIDTKQLARDLDARYFQQESPGKFKMAVSGCPNNCSKPVENDVGIMGGVLPEWVEYNCIACCLCENICPTAAISIDEAGQHFLHEEQCILCGICISDCPTDAWQGVKKGYTLYLGGTMGKKPRLGTKARILIQSQEELCRHIDKAFEFYKKHGRKKERFGHTLERIGVEKALQEVLDDD